MSLSTITLLCLQCFVFHKAVKHNGNVQSLQLFFITGFDKNYLHASLLELWWGAGGFGGLGVDSVYSYGFAQALLLTGY